MAEEGRLDPVIGRGDEIRRVLQIVKKDQKTIYSCWRTRVGKTAIAKDWHSVF